MCPSVRHSSLLAAIVTVGLSIVSCGPNRFAGVASVIVTPDASAEEEAVDVPGEGDEGPATAAGAVADATVGTGDTDGADGADGAEEGSTPTDSPCVALCAVLAGTRCPPDPAACPVGCEAQIADLCGGESRALLSCQAGLSPADFSCDSRSHLVMDAAKCQPESDALGVCLADL